MLDCFSEPMPVRTWSDLRVQSIGPDSDIYIGTVPDSVCPDFEQLWSLHPAEQPVVVLYKEPVRLPRWQKAYGRDYMFSGQTSIADSVPDILMPILNWAQMLHPGMNGLLLNWYDSNLCHYIGPHQDSKIGLMPMSPIITVSFGSDRTFRLRPAKPQRKGSPVDLTVSNQDIVIIPWSTNENMTHEVLHRVKNTGRRVSVTLRAFRT